VIAKQISVPLEPTLKEYAENNILFVGIKAFDARFEDSDVFMEGGTCRVVAGSFRNQAIVGKPVRTLQSIRAHVIYRDRNNAEILSVPSACLLNHKDGVADLSVGQTIHVILAAYNSVSWASVWNQDATSRDAWKQSTSMRDNALNSGPMSAEIHLIDSEGVSLIGAQATFQLYSNGMIFTDDNDLVKNKATR
jgi:hypothetical protein